MKALKKGYKLSNKGLYICISKRAVSVKFSRVIRTANDTVSGFKLAIDEFHVACNEIGVLLLGRAKHNDLHKTLGHFGFNGLEKATKIHSLKIINEFRMCKEGAIAKARQKNVNK
jgi:hypothetical protein